MSANDARVRARFSELLLEAPTRDLRAGWELARDLGPVVAPSLFGLASDEKSNMKRRMSAFCAAVMASDPHGEDRVLAALDDKSPMQDRLCASFLLALGPLRERAPSDFWAKSLGRNKQEPEPVLLVAALLAGSRFPGVGASCPQSLLRVDNPGVLAAAVLCGAPAPEPLLQPYLQKRAPAHANLVQRAWLLRAVLQRNVSAASPELAERAREWMQSPGEANATLREAAALALGASGSLRMDGQTRPDWRMLQLFAFDAKACEALAGWIPAQPQPLDEPAWPRLAVAYALGRPVERVVADRSAWASVPSVRRHVAIALAMRLCREPRSKAVAAALPEVAEWAFVRWAMDEPFPDAAAFVEPALQQAAVMAKEDRLSREAAARLFEDTLWRWGSHPGIGLRDVQRDLVRDLMLSGSLPGNRYAIGLPDHLRYLPAGLGNENDFFGIAVEAWELLRSPALPIPPECRLR